MVGNNGVTMGGSDTGKNSDNDTPEEIEIKIERPVMEASLDRMGSVFNETARKNFGGINSASSVFAKGTQFQATPLKEED
jgi:hypothetical protein